MKAIQSGFSIRYTLLTDFKFIKTGILLNYFQTLINFNEQMMTMKILIIILIFFTLQMNAQQRRDNYREIDRKVSYIPVSGADSLAARLAALGNTDREKVRAFFRWITEHIEYNVRIYNRNKTSPGLFYEEPDDSLAPLPSLNERIATKVLYKRIAFCDGYSRLFKVLCDFAGIKSEVINGFARTNMNRSGRFGVNHTWNAVYLDSTWHLLDVTWASGFISYDNEYVKQYNDFYFLTPPDEFLRDHYPEDPQWTLLPQPPAYREFNQSPFRYSGYNKTGITSYWPVKGVIEASAGDSVRFELKTRKQVKNFFVSGSSVPDSVMFSFASSFSFDGEKVSFTYPVSPGTGEWLYVFCNDEPVLRYKLNVKKDVVKDE
jgi:hypothetical protein